MALLILFVLIALILTFTFFFQKFRYFKKRGIIGPVPGLFGNLKETFFKKRHISYEINDIYKYLNKCRLSTKEIKFSALF